MVAETLDLSVLRKSWDDVKTLEAYTDATLGVNMMVKIFTRNPTIKHLWKFAADLQTESEIRAALVLSHNSFKIKSASVKNHGKNIMRSVNTLIEKLDNVTDAEKFLYDLGVRHIKYGSKEEHLPIIGGALLETIKEGLGEKYDSDAEVAWGHAISFVALHVTKGLKEEQQ